MKKLIFILLTAFFACSMAVNAQNSSKLLDNSNISKLNQHLEKVETKLQTATTQAEIDDLNQTKAEIQQKMEAFEQSFAKRVGSDASTGGRNLSSSVPERKTINQQQIPEESLNQKAALLNQNFIDQGLNQRAQVVEVNGKQIIKLVEIETGAKYYQSPSSNE